MFQIVLRSVNIAVNKICWHIKGKATSCLLYDISGGIRLSNRGHNFVDKVEKLCMILLT